MLGVGVVGSGFMGRTWARVAAERTPGARLVAVTGGRRAAGLAQDFGVPEPPDLAAMLADPDVGIVVLATPPAGHAEQAIAVAAAGRHLLLEKPMANSVAECRAIVKACSDADVRLAVVAQHRFRASPLAARRLVDDGAIGRITMVRAIGPEVGFWDTARTQDQWKLDPAQQTTYASWGAHACDLIRWFVGDEPDLAFAMFEQYGDGPPPLRSAMASYHFRHGAMAQVWMSYDIPPPGLGSGLQLQLVGTRGMIELDSYGVVRLGTADGWSTPFSQPRFDSLDPADPVRLAAYAAELTDLVNAVERAVPPQVDGREGLATTMMLEAAEISARTGTAVKLPLA